MDVTDVLDIIATLITVGTFIFAVFKWDEIQARKAYAEAPAQTDTAHAVTLFPDAASPGPESPAGERTRSISSPPRSGRTMAKRAVVWGLGGGVVGVLYSAIALRAFPPTLQTDISSAVAGTVVALPFTLPLIIGFLATVFTRHYESGIAAGIIAIALVVAVLFISWVIASIVPPGVSLVEFIAGILAFLFVFGGCALIWANVGAWIARILVKARHN